MKFNREHFPRFKDHYMRLVEEGQKPQTLFIGCSDSRLDPARLTDASPGELFVVRNVGAFVPSFEADEGFHGISAAIEFAVAVLRVSNVVVCGHSYCGAVEALYRIENRATPHVNRWLELGREAMLSGPVDRGLLHETERRSIAIQVERLLTFPMLKERFDAGEIRLHGWHYVIEEGLVYALDRADGQFKPVRG